jgi:hypothetical protein
MPFFQANEHPIANEDMIKQLNSYHIPGFTKPFGYFTILIEKVASAVNVIMTALPHHYRHLGYLFYVKFSQYIY